MDFDFSDEQKALREAVRSSLSGLAPREAVRAMVDDGARMPDATWAAIAELGWPGLLVPAAAGGLGLGIVDAVVVCEETGRLPLPGPFFSSAVFATLVASRLGADDLLARLATGELRAAVALDEAGTAAAPLDGVRTRATRGSHGWVLDGLKPVVADGAAVDVVLVVARDDDGVATFAVDAPAAQPVPGLDPTRALARLELVSAPARRVGPAGDQTALLARAVDDTAVLLCAELVGCCDAAFELAADYAKARTQFGRPIGSFQAVKHLGADMLRDLTLARVATHYAAWCADTDAPERESAAAMAKAWVAEAAIEVTGTCVQIHGGVGFTWDCDAHLYYKRAKASDLVLGRQGWQRARLADLLLGPAPEPVPA